VIYRFEGITIAGLRGWPVMRIAAGIIGLAPAAPAGWALDAMTANEASPARGRLQALRGLRGGIRGDAEAEGRGS
jgi:hypothetical protein